MGQSAPDTSKLSFILSRLKYYYQTSESVFKLIRQTEAPNAATVQAKHETWLPAILSSYSRALLKELGCEVRVGVGAKPSLALYAEDPENKIAAILSDNTDFFVFNLPCATFRLRNLDFTQGTVEKLDQPALLRKLQIEAEALPVLAALMGDTEIKAESFLQNMWKKYSLTHPRNGYYCDISKVAPFANEIARNRSKMRGIAAELPANYFQSTLDFYNLVPENEEAPADVEAGEDEWSQVLRFAKQKMTQISIFRDIYDLLKHGQYQVRDGLEDYENETLLVSCQLLQPVFRRLYGYLYQERPLPAGGRNQVLVVHEYSTAYVKDSKGVKLVQPAAVKGDYPPPYVLWKLPANDSTEDWETRCGLLLAILVPNLWAEEKRRHQILELLRKLPGRLILTVLLAIWSQTGTQDPIFEEVAKEALLLQTAWIYKNADLPDDFQKMTYDSLDARVVHLSNFFGSLAHAIGLLVAVVGYPIPWQETMPWKFYHGPVFAYCCMEGRQQLKFEDLDGDVQQYIAQMKCIVSMACDMPNLEA